MQERCGWCGTDPLYVAYHDREWGVPERDARALWEMLVLEGFQAGLSWITILKKRERFRAAFAGFDPVVISGWGADAVDRLAGDPGIVRHRGKIEATLSNARAWMALEDREGFGNFLWKYVEGRPIQSGRQTLSDIPGQTDLSARISRDLKKQGFRFCGPTTVYSLMQASGMVNDHLLSCPRHAPVARMG